MQDVTEIDKMIFAQPKQTIRWGENNGCAKREVITPALFKTLKETVGER